MAASDICRLSVSVQGEAWSAQLLNELAAVKPGASQPVSVYVSRKAGAAAATTVTLGATSESGPTKTVSAACKVSAR